jgi:hypothetical protein
MKENRDRFGSMIVKYKDIVLLLIPNIEPKLLNSHTLKFEQHIYSGNCVKVFGETLEKADVNPVLVEFILYSLNSSGLYIRNVFNEKTNPLRYKLPKKKCLSIAYRPGFYYRFVNGKFVLDHSVDFWLYWIDLGDCSLPAYNTETHSITYWFSNDELNLLIKEKKIRKLIDKLTRNTHSSMLIHTRECLKRFGV